MNKRVLKLVGVVFGFVILGSVLTSCKTHEVCPAYTKAKAPVVDVQ